MLFKFISPGYYVFCFRKLIEKIMGVDFVMGMDCNETGVDTQVGNPYSIAHPKTLKRIFACLDSHSDYMWGGDL